MDKFFTEKQRQDIAFFEENIKTWADNPLYRLKSFVISGKEIRGFYDTFEAALRFAVVNFGKGEYIIQQILPDEGTMSEIYGEYSLLDLEGLTVVPPVIQRFLDERYEQQSTDSVAFVVR